MILTIDHGRQRPSRILRAAAAFCFVALLPACLADSPTTGATTAKPFSFGARKAVLVSAPIVPSRVIAKGPAGFCIDKRSMKSGRGGGFAMLASCAALGGEPTGGEEPVLLTIQAQLKGLQPAPETAAGLAEAFAAQGPIYQETGDGLSLVQLSAGGGQIVPNGEPKHWRATLSFNGYLVGLAVYSEKGGAAAGKRGKALLIAFAEQVLEASPIAAADPALAFSEGQPKPKNTRLPKLFNNLLQ